MEDKKNSNLCLSNIDVRHNNTKAHRYKLNQLVEDWSDSLLQNVVNSINKFNFNIDTSEIEWNDTINLSSVDFTDHTLKEGIFTSNIIHVKYQEETLPVNICKVDDNTIIASN